MPKDVPSNANSDKWKKMLSQGHRGKKYWNRAMRLLPGPPRCKACNNPFGGIGGHICRAVGLKPSKKNPRICALCCESMPRGGAEIETVILFADVRGSTELAERLGPEQFTEALNKFYTTSVEILIRFDATVDKLIGDEVMAFFVPGFAGPDFKRRAVEAGKELLCELGYGPGGNPQLPVGVGIDCGVAFVGNVGSEDFVDFTALGDPVNTAARIQALAGPGQLLVGANVFAAVAQTYPDVEAVDAQVKGKIDPLSVYSIPLISGSPASVPSF
jgi:adenylate cyclase